MKNVNLWMFWFCKHRLNIAFQIQFNKIHKNINVAQKNIIFKINFCKDIISCKLGIQTKKVGIEVLKFWLCWPAACPRWPPRGSTGRWWPSWWWWTRARNGFRLNCSNQQSNCEKYNFLKFKWFCNFSLI